MSSKRRSIFGLTSVGADVLKTALGFAGYTGYAGALRGLSSKKVVKIGKARWV